MTVDAVQCYEPVARESYLERFHVLTARSGVLPAEFWENLHREVQLILRNLEKSARQKDPSVQIQTARTSGTGFCLFTYRVFEPTDKTIEPVVVGLTFTAKDGSIELNADISGEESGDLIATIPNRIVPATEATVTEAARELATDLSGYGKQLATALVDPARKLS